MIRSRSRFTLTGVAELYGVSAAYLRNAKQRGTKIANYGRGRPRYLPCKYENLLTDLILNVSEAGLPMSDKDILEAAHSLRLGIDDESKLPSLGWLNNCFFARNPDIQEIHGREIEPSRLITADLPAAVYSYERLRDGIKGRQIKVKNFYCADETSWIWCLTPKRKVGLIDNQPKLGRISYGTL